MWPRPGRALVELDGDLPLQRLRSAVLPRLPGEQRRAEVPGVPNHLTLSPDEQYLYVPIYDKGVLAVIDTKTHQVVASVDVGKGPHGTQLGPTGKHLYVGDM